MTPHDHQKALGIMHLVYGGFHLLLLAVVSLFVFIGVAGAVAGEPFNSGELPVAFVVMTLIWAVGAFLTLPPLIAGYGLLKRKRWARVAGIVSACLSALNFPFGTALAAYSIWFFFGEHRNFYDAPQAHGARPPYALKDDASTVSTFGWDAQTKTYAEREREYAPPAQPPDWR